MKQTLKTIIRNVKSIKGNSLAEFATTTALMATLAATAAPKLSEMSEGAKGEKSRNELDKLVKQAGQFYQDTADEEGRGRFPGQDKYDRAVSGGSYGTHTLHEAAILDDLMNTYDDYRDADGSDWKSVFGVSNPDFPKPTGSQISADDQAGTCSDCPGANYNLATILTYNGKLNEAKKFLLKSIKLNSNLINAYYSLINVLRDLGEIEESINLSEKILKLKSNNCEYS